MLDVRPVDAFAAGHHKGALNVPWTGTRFSTKAAFVLDPERPVVGGRVDQDEARAAIGGLRSVGYLEVAGWMRGGGGEKLRLVALEGSTRCWSRARS